MTRKEQIEKAAKQKYPYEGGTKGTICEWSIPIFIQGAEWADGHPNQSFLLEALRDLNEVKTAIEEAEGLVVERYDNRYVGCRIHSIANLINYR